jgi:hypothetical protein
LQTPWIGGWLECLKGECSEEFVVPDGDHEVVGGTGGQCGGQGDGGRHVLAGGVADLDRGLVLFSETEQSFEDRAGVPAVGLRGVRGLGCLDLGVAGGGLGDLDLGAEAVLVSGQFDEPVLSSFR